MCFCSFRRSKSLSMLDANQAAHDVLRLMIHGCRRWLLWCFAELGGTPKRPRAEQPLGRYASNNPVISRIAALQLVAVSATADREFLPLSDDPKNGNIVCSPVCSFVVLSLVAHAAFVVHPLFHFHLQHRTRLLVPIVADQQPVRTHPATADRTRGLRRTTRPTTTRDMSKWLSWSRTPKSGFQSVATCAVAACGCFSGTMATVGGALCWGLRLPKRDIVLFRCADNWIYVMRTTVPTMRWVFVYICILFILAVLPRHWSHFNKKYNPSRNIQQPTNGQKVGQIPITFFMDQRRKSIFSL